LPDPRDQWWVRRIFLIHTHFVSVYQSTQILAYDYFSLCS
jgi:hypothetical protein